MEANKLTLMEDIKMNIQITLKATWHNITDVWIMKTKTTDSCDILKTTF